MHRKEIKYVGFYDVLDSQSDRVSNLAAINKMNYISDALVEAGYDVKFISPSWMGNETEKKFEKQTVIEVDENKQVVFCPSWKTKNKFTRNIKVIFSLMWLFFYLLFTTQKNEKVLAYHVPWISLPVRAAKFFKKFNLILEVEEIYGAVWESKKLMDYWEKNLIESADAYIFVSDLLKKRLEVNNKKGLVLYGSYNVKNINLDATDNVSNKIKLVYAGSVDEVKGGAFKAVETMNYLSNFYFLHILGHGDRKSISKLKNMIDEINFSKEDIVCSYEGTIHGKEYSSFLSSCDIALNPQNQGEYMLTAFPSKIISYLNHDLRVVTTDIQSIRESKVADLLYFAKDDDPKSIAKVIKDIDLKQKYNSNKFIQNLHQEFVFDIKKLIEEREISN